MPRSAAVLPEARPEERLRLKRPRFRHGGPGHIRRVEIEWHELGAKLAFDGAGTRIRGGKVETRKENGALCSNMPRLGASGHLTPEQIAHVVAYLIDPQSPVNKK